MPVSHAPMYLRRDVQVEPLVDQWYAWCHLIPPATTARNITHRHLKIMDSFLNGPQVHASAAKNPKMLGGPFIDHGADRVEDVRALRDRTKSKRAALIALSEALEQLDALLRTAPDGHTIQPLYSAVPDILRGYVELSYDIRNSASFRVIEPLLYRSPFYDRSAQSFVLSHVTGDDRPFVLSTPRLPSADELHLPWSFDDPRVAQLFRLKSEPRAWADILALLDAGPADERPVASFFTPEPPPPYARYDGNGVRWRYFGHACILVETRHLSVLLDPVLSYTYESQISRYTYDDLPDHLDYVLITHNHQDHILLETLLQIRHKVGEIIVPRGGSGTLPDPSIKLALQHAGFSRVRELGELETIDLPGGAITGVPFLGEHADLAVSTKLAYLVRFGTEQLLFAADSCNIEPRLYDHVHALVGDVGTLFLGMECDGAPLSWLYGPLLVQPLERGKDRSRRLSGSDYAQGIAMVDRFHCHDVYVYAMGQEPWLNHVMKIKYTEESRPIVESNRLIADCRARGITCERLFGEKEILLDCVHQRLPGLAV